MNAKDQKNIERAAKAGGEVLRKYFGKVLTITEKSMASDVRTEADVESEASIIGILKKEFPTYNIFSEECGKIDRDSEYTFHIDPLDGTNNFTLGIPNFSVSIALVSGMETIFGPVYLPVTGLMYTAAKGEGAFCNGRKLKVSDETILKKSTISLVFGYHCYRPLVAKAVRNFSSRTKRFLFSWSVASDLCLLASGKIETAVVRDAELWDFLAGKLIAVEAGCVVTDFSGKPEKNDLNRRFIISNNREIHRKVLPLV